MKRRSQQDTPRVLALAVAFFGAFAALGWVDGVFARLPRETLAALALLAGVFAAATYALDVEVRAFLNRALRLRPGPARSPAGKRAAT